MEALRNRAALSLPAGQAQAPVNDPDAEGHLVPAGGVDLVRLPVGVDQRAGAVPLTGVIEDDLLVELVEFVHTHLWK